MATARTCAHSGQPAVVPVGNMFRLYMPIPFGSFADVLFDLTRAGVDDVIAHMKELVRLGIPTTQLSTLARYIHGREDASQDQRDTAQAIVYALAMRGPSAANRWVSPERQSL